MQKVLLIGYLGRDPEVKYSHRERPSRSFPSPPRNDGRTRTANCKNTRNGLP